MPSYQDINLLPQKYQDVEERGRKFSYYSKLSLLLIILLLIVVLGVYFYHSQVRSNWVVVQDEVEEVKSYITEEDSKSKEGKLLVIKNKTKLLSQFLVQRREYSTYLQDFFEKIPPSVQINSLSYEVDQEGYVFAGVASDLEQFNYIVRAVDNLESIQESTVELIQYSSRGAVTFRILMQT